MTAPFAERLEAGKVGERIVHEFLRQKGLVPYCPPEDCKHPFDRLVATADKRQLCIVEVKTKPRREAYEDTGINHYHFDEYQAITSRYHIPLFLAFVDKRTGTMYGNWWHELVKPRAVTWHEYPMHDRGIVYFPLAAMRTLYVLSADERAELEHR